MNWKSLLAMLVVALFVVGCSSAPAPTPAPTTAPTDAPVAPTASAAVAVEFVSVPAEVTLGKPVMVSWKVTGVTTTVHTAVHYDTKSHADVAIADLTTQTYPSASPRAYLSGDTTNAFETSFAFDEMITVYMRAHTIVDGQSYWTEEKSVKMVVPVKATTTTETAMTADTSSDSASDDGTSSGY